MGTCARAMVGSDSELLRRAHVDEAQRAGGFLERVERDLDVRIVALVLATTRQRGDYGVRAGGGLGAWCW